MSVTQSNVNQVRAHATRDLGIISIVEVHLSATLRSFGNYALPFDVAIVKTLLKKAS